MSPLSKKIVSIKAELEHDRAMYTGLAGSVSENSIYLITSPSKASKNFDPGTLFELKLQLSSEETLSINCKVIWSYRTPPHGLTNSIGVEVAEQQQTYQDFFESLSYD